MTPSPRLGIAVVHRDLHAPTRGGLCTLYRALANELAERGHHVTLITQHTPHPVPPQLRTAAGGSLQVVTLPRTGDSVAELAAHGKRVSAVLDELRPDVAECSSWEHELVHYLTRSHPRASVVVRGDLSVATMGAAHLADGEHTLVTHAEWVLAVSTFAAADLHRAYGIQAQVVPNGIDTTRFHPYAAGPPASGDRIHLDRHGQVTRCTPLPQALATDEVLAGFFGPRRPEDLLRLVWVGKATKMKGWDQLERLAPRLTGMATLLIVLGHGQVHYPVTIGKQPHVRVLQDLDDRDLPGVYTAADWLVSTSRWEGFGLAIAEALACGTPALLPAGLGVADEILAAGGGATYRSLDDLLQHLPHPPPRVRLPQAFAWSANAEASLATYRHVIPAHALQR